MFKLNNYTTGEASIWEQSAEGGIWVFKNEQEDREKWTLRSFVISTFYPELVIRVIGWM
jgi:hypothetical protein